MADYHDNLTTLAKRLRPLITSMVRTTVLETTTPGMSDIWAFPAIVIDDNGTQDFLTGNGYHTYLPLLHTSAVGSEVYGGVYVPAFTGILTVTPLIQCSSSSDDGSFYSTVDALELGGDGVQNLASTFGETVTLPSTSTHQIAEATEIELSFNGTGNPWKLSITTFYLSGLAQAHVWHGWRISFGG